MPFDLFSGFFKTRSAGSSNTGGLGFWKISPIIGIRRNTATPPVPTALDIWLDADDEDTLVTSGSEVISWTDKSSNGIVFSQGTPSKRPLLSLGATFNRNILKFSRASAQILTSTSSVSSAEGDVFVVGTFDTMPGSGELYQLYGKSPNDNFQQWNLAFRFSGTIGYNITNDPTVGSTGSVLATTGSLSTGDSNPHYIHFSSDDTTWFIRDKDDIAFSLSLLLGSNTGNWSASVTSTQMSVGGFTGSSETHHLNGGINEILSYNRQLTDVERKATRDYLAVKWGF